MTKQEKILKRALEMAIEQINTPRKKTIKVWIWYPPGIGGKRSAQEVSIYPRGGLHWIEGRLSYGVPNKAKEEMK